MGGICDEDFLRFVCLADGLDGLLGHEVGNEKYGEFDGDARNNQRDEKICCGGLFFLVNCTVEECAEVFGKFGAAHDLKCDIVIKRGAFVCGTSRNDVNGGEGDKNHASGDAEIDKNKFVAKFLEHFNPS